MTWSSTAKAFKTVMLKESKQFQKEILDMEKDKPSRELLKSSFKREQAKIKAINEKLKHFMQKHGVKKTGGLF